MQDTFGASGVVSSETVCFLHMYFDVSRTFYLYSLETLNPKPKLPLNPKYIAL